ncbi:PREDICTED: uncharacterized protein LOC106740582 [Dinoponera quadriceps]|uniref:Uncharacterized protein LOC106740582 n=1 Tax=Dinoponera quadriceps TaxID=609295 RepID=A0A6P3WMF3_DINQU|nr:PREDICTED: uncharacterized protein LOC106740582 [Dinoponera quadriceps]
MIWTGEHRGFAVRSFLENGRSVIATQRVMRLRFHIPRHVSVPDGKTIKRWVSSLEETGSTELSEQTNLGEIWFQQDGATAHTARISMAKLRQMFPTRLVSLRGDLGWPARSPDLSICDFFLWGYLKEKVFKHRPHTLQELKRRIIEEVNAIPIQMCQNAARSFQNRLHQCIATGGRHLADIVFKR